jgi:hypothetical protein
VEGQQIMLLPSQTPITPIKEHDELVLTDASPGNRSADATNPHQQQQQHPLSPSEARNLSGPLVDQRRPPPARRQLKRGSLRGNDSTGGSSVTLVGLGGTPASKRLLRRMSLERNLVRIESVGGELVDSELYERVAGGSGPGGLLRRPSAEQRASGGGVNMSPLALPAAGLSLRAVHPAPVVPAQRASPRSSPADSRVVH